jgi:hypothetical protein
MSLIRAKFFELDLKQVNKSLLRNLFCAAASGVTTQE